MKKKILVLGAGLVGKAIAIDLSKEYDVTALDINRQNLEPLADGYAIKTMMQDVADFAGLKNIIQPFDLVIGAVPGFLGFETLKAVIESGKNVVDISFFARDAFELDDLAKEANVTAIVDCGVAPGMSNVLLGYHNARMHISSFTCYVGGLPVARTWPYQYKAPFSPIDVIEEYTRPARYVENGHIVTKPAMSDPELIDFQGIGTLEAFNTDGLRSLLKTIKIPNMKEKTLRYPGHIEYMNVLKHAGYLSSEPVEINGHAVRPIDVTAKLLLPLWRLEPNEEEFTVMKIIIQGEENGSEKTLTYSLYDKYDVQTHTSSMARTTGYTCTAAARILLDFGYDCKGIIPPEYLGEDEAIFQKILHFLGERNIFYHLNYGEE
jgi:lysine 6-dehydrogenase